MDIESYKLDIAHFIAKECLYKPKEKYMFGKLAGTRYPSQYYLTSLLYDAAMMEKIAVCFFEMVKQEIGHFNFQLAGREWSSIPLLTGIPVYMRNIYHIEVNSFLIRKSRKTYGRNNYIEGKVNNFPVMIVDDLSNSQDGFLHCHKVLLGEKIDTIPYTFSVLNKYRKSYEENMNHDRYLGDQYKSLFIVSGDDIDAARSN